MVKSEEERTWAANVVVFGGAGVYKAWEPIGALPSRWGQSRRLIRTTWKPAHPPRLSSALLWHRRRGAHNVGKRNALTTSPQPEKMAEDGVRSAGTSTQHQPKRNERRRSKLRMKKRCPAHVPSRLQSLNGASHSSLRMPTERRGKLWVGWRPMMDRPNHLRGTRIHFRSASVAVFRIIGGRNVRRRLLQPCERSRSNAERRSLGKTIPIIILTG